MKKVFFFGMITMLFFSCQKQNKIENVERAFYYWKSDESHLNDAEYKILDSLKVEDLYVKLFEVKYDQTMGNIPIAKTSVNNGYWYGSDLKKDTLNIIPTVFIKNEVFLKSKKDELDTLAHNVKYLVSKYHKDRFRNYPDYNEIQIDCDWTIKSKDNYFYFLKELARVTKKDLSCTLRLYPYKYRTKMGVPPVKRATLMCYNLIQPFAERNKNSILDIKELETYLTVDKKYPIHLDIALPLFSWGFHYQYDEFKGFVKVDEGFLKKTCDRKSDFWYEIKKDTSLNDTYFRIGDKIKYEDVGSAKVSEAIKELRQKVKFDQSARVTFFHLDSVILKKYKYETLDRYYSSFYN
jgi:hypothetical protein